MKGDARLGGVSAALLAPWDAPAPEAPAARRAAAWCEALFEELLWVGPARPSGARGRRVEPLDSGALGALAAALREARGERLLALDARAPGAPDLWLALLAAPAADAVAVARPSAPAPAPLPALYRRRPALEALGPLLAEGATEPERLTRALAPRLLDAAEAEALAAGETPEPVGGGAASSRPRGAPIRRGSRARGTG